jgi:integrase
MPAVKGHPGIFTRQHKTKPTTYHFRTYPNGKEKWSKGYPSQKAALAARAETKKAQAQGTWVEPTKMKFKEAAERYMAEGRPSRIRDTSQKVYRDQLNARIYPVLGHLPLQKIDEDVLAKYVVDYRDRYSPRVIKSDLVRIGAVFNFAMNSRRGWVAKNPVTTMEPHELPDTPAKLERVITEEELLDLYAAIHPGYLLITKALASTGMRVSEALALRWSDIDFDTRTISITKTMRRDFTLGPPKTASSRRHVSIGHALADELREQRDHPEAVLSNFVKYPGMPDERAAAIAASRLTDEERKERSRIRMARHRAKKAGKPYPPATPRPRHPRVTYRVGAGRIEGALNKMLPPSPDPSDPYVFYWVTYPALNTALRRACVAVGIEAPGAGGNRNHDVVIHTLRHSFGSKYLYYCKNIAKVSREMGHKNISTTMDIYSHDWSLIEKEMELQNYADQIGGLDRPAIEPPAVLELEAADEQMSLAPS